MNDSCHVRTTTAMTRFAKASRRSGFLNAVSLQGCYMDNSERVPVLAAFFCNNLTGVNFWPVCRNNKTGATPAFTQSVFAIPLVTRQYNAVIWSRLLLSFFPAQFVSLAW
jgi:hypothetical protein